MFGYIADELMIRKTGLVVRLCYEVRWCDALDLTVPTSVAGIHIVERFVWNATNEVHVRVYVSTHTSTLILDTVLHTGVTGPVFQLQQIRKVQLSVAQSIASLFLLPRTHVLPLASKIGMHVHRNAQVRPCNLIPSVQNV